MKLLNLNGTFRTVLLLSAGILISSHVLAADETPTSTSSPEVSKGETPTPTNTENSKNTYEKYYFAGQGAFEYSSTTAAAGASTPTIFTEGIGLTADYRLSDIWLVGLSTDFVFINQTTDPGTTGANFSGTRWNIISPTFGAQLNKHLLLLDVEFLGNWTLKNAAANSGTAQYQNPIGFRLRYSHPLGFINNVSLGAQFEYLSFSTINNSITGSASLTTNQTLAELGAILVYAL
jgi:hypothetical protein